MSLSFLARLADDIFLAFRAISVVAGSELELLELELKLELLIPSKELALATVGSGTGMLNRLFVIFEDVTNHWSSDQNCPTNQYPKRI